MARSNRRGKVSRRNRITNVRLADASAGPEGLRVDRMIQAVQQSESQIRCLVGDIVDLSATTTGGVGFYDINNLLGTDEFNSLIQQWQTYRVTAIKYDIYDVNSGVAVLNNWSTFHDDYNGSPAAQTRANVADGPDSRTLSVGAGQTTLYWVAHGVEENRFQADSTSGAAAQRFGGLRYYIGSAGAVTTKYQLVVHAVVDFRGRI